MRLMEEKILAEGKVLPGGVLQVGSFLNQRIDTRFLKEMGRAMAELFAGEGVTLVLTVESSGIAIATAVGMELDVPIVFAKKQPSSNLSGEYWTAPVRSFTRQTEHTLIVSTEYLGPDDHVLLADDFLASGSALRAMLELTRRAGATVAGAAVAIEKKFQGGGDALRDAGIRVESLAKISRMDAQGIEFC